MHGAGVHLDENFNSGTILSFDASYRALYIKNFDVTHSLKVFIVLYTHLIELILIFVMQDSNMSVSVVHNKLTYT